MPEWRRRRFYICQTGHSFKHRYNEHMKALHCTIESTFVNHLTEADHTHTNINNNKEIYMWTERIKLDRLEKLEIYTKIYRNNILNNQTQFILHTHFEHINQNLTDCVPCWKSVYISLLLYTNSLNKIMIMYVTWSCYHIQSNLCRHDTLHNEKLE